MSPTHPRTTRIGFALNGEDQDVAVGPAERLLDLLRYRFDLTGTKEGCGEGECGACTVHLDGLPVDSCLVPAVQVDGRRVDTIESLDPDELGPLLSSGATQCGACTPGVVMTADWVRRNAHLVSAHPVRELMAGNLCRCTGYDGIVDGVEALLAREATEGGPAEARVPRGVDVPDSDTSRVRSPRPLERTGVVGRGRVLSPRSLEEALEAMNRRPEATPIAGATDLYVHWPTHLEAHDRSYIDLTRIDALRGTRWTDDALVLGGLCTYWDVIRDPRIDAEFPLLREAGRQVGAVQIQTRGTWAGNIVNGSPAADGVPVLMAYDAVLTLVSAAGEEEVALDDFYLGYKDMRLRPGQLISAITIPRRGYSVQWFDKVGSRAAQAITKVGVAVTCSDEKEWRVVVNSVAPVVKRCPALERLLTGTRAPTLDQVRAATRADVSPIDDIRSTAEYRERVLARLVYFGLETHGPQDARA